MSMIQLIFIVTIGMIFLAFFLKISMINKLIVTVVFLFQIFVLLFLFDARYRTVLEAADASGKYSNDFVRGVVASKEAHFDLRFLMVLSCAVLFIFALVPPRK
ncbi:MAG: hypothetical protein IPM37_10860 [Hahellaceae bacterium]|nr:hypothetical protein [Hahellaceae bacterium]